MFAGCVEGKNRKKKKKEKKFFLFLGSRRLLGKKVGGALFGCMDSDFFFFSACFFSFLQLFFCFVLKIKKELKWYEVSDWFSRKVGGVFGLIGVFRQSAFFF